MKNRIKPIVAGSLFLLLVFVLINIVWYISVSSIYSCFTSGMQRDDDGSIIRRYYMVDEDGFDYNVKYPDYLKLKGNLGISMPWVDYDNPWTDSLIIWPSVTGDCELGVILYEEDENNDENFIEYQIYIDKSGEPVDKQYDEIIAGHKDNINALLSKARDQWGSIF